MRRFGFQSPRVSDAGQQRRPDGGGDEKSSNGAAVRARASSYATGGSGAHPDAVVRSGMGLGDAGDEVSLALTHFERIMCARSEEKVRRSRDAAVYLHSKVNTINPKLKILNPEPSDPKP